jgi:hypothetical protein
MSLNKVLKFKRAPVQRSLAREAKLNALKAEYDMLLGIKQVIEVKSPKPVARDMPVPLWSLAMAAQPSLILHLYAPTQ